MEHSLHLWQMCLRKLHLDVDCWDFGKEMEEIQIIFFCSGRSLKNVDANANICSYVLFFKVSLRYRKTTIREISRQLCALITDKQTNITGQRTFYCSLKKNIFQFSWDFYELVSEGIITIICCHWDGMRWEHCDCNGQFWDGTGWDLDLISRIFTSLQPHLRHSGVDLSQILVENI